MAGTDLADAVKPVSNHRLADPPRVRDRPNSADDFVLVAGRADGARNLEGSIREQKLARQPRCQLSILPARVVGSPPGVCRCNAGFAGARLERSS